MWGSHPGTGLRANKENKILWCNTWISLGSPARSLPMVVTQFLLLVLVAPGNHPSLETWCPPRVVAAAEKRASGWRQLTAASWPPLSLLSFLKCQLKGFFHPDITGQSGSHPFPPLGLPDFTWSPSKFGCWGTSGCTALKPMVLLYLLQDSISVKPSSFLQGYKLRLEPVPKCWILPVFVKHRKVFDLSIFNYFSLLKLQIRSRGGWVSAEPGGQHRGHSLPQRWLCWFWGWPCWDCTRYTSERSAREHTSQTGYFSLI